VLLLRWCDCSCDVHLCSLHFAHAKLTIITATSHTTVSLLARALLAAKAMMVIKRRQFVRAHERGWLDESSLQVCTCTLRVCSSMPCDVRDASCLSIDPHNTTHIRSILTIHFTFDCSVCLRRCVRTYLIFDRFFFSRHCLFTSFHVFSRLSRLFTSFHVFSRHCRTCYRAWTSVRSNSTRFDTTPPLPDSASTNLVVGCIFIEGDGHKCL
jgi:hypothetical protein